jgi:hypothetical protein
MNGSKARLVGRNFIRETERVSSKNDPMKEPSHELRGDLGGGGAKRTRDQSMLWVYRTDMGQCRPN